jgi:integrase
VSLSLFGYPRKLECQAATLGAATSPCGLRTFLVAAATGCRRGEVLALRSSDIVDGYATVARSLTQTRDVLEFKCTKTEKPRAIRIPETALPALEAHRKQQDEFRRQFGADYRSDLDLIFASPEGTPLKPDSVSVAVSLLFRRLKLPREPACIPYATRTRRSVRPGCIADGDQRPPGPTVRFG